MKIVEEYGTLVDENPCSKLIVDLSNRPKSSRDSTVIIISVQKKPQMIGIFIWKRSVQKPTTKDKFYYGSQ